MNPLEKTLQDDVNNISKITIIPNLLDVICRTTGMGFAAVARVTETQWIVCQVKDDINFGLEPGGELELKTTICNEIRDSMKGVVISNVSEDEHFRTHHTPAQYGFQSYISIPIFRRDKSFFGTLCAIDPKPHDLNKPEIIGMFTLFTDLISFHLETVDELNSSQSDLQTQLLFTEQLEAKIAERTRELEINNAMLVRSNEELQEFNYISSHDLQEPLRKIQTFVSLLQKSETGAMTESGKRYLDKISESANRMRLLIDDLLAYSETDKRIRQFEHVAIEPILRKVLDDLHEEIDENAAVIEIGNVCSATVVPFQIAQLFYNIIGNSLKYASKDRQIKIDIEAEIIEGNTTEYPELEDRKYCRITISDNGIGFDPKYNEKIFGLFQRLHCKTEYGGTGVGLAIVKKIVENHNGIVIADSRIDKGSRFSIFLPEAQ